MSHCFVPDLVLAEQERQEHQHASIMDNPPHVYMAFSETLSIGRVAGNILWNQQGHAGYSGLSDNLCRGIGDNSLVQRYVGMELL